jgi:hypothetical protein
MAVYSAKYLPEKACRYSPNKRQKDDKEIDDFQKLTL